MITREFNLYLHAGHSIPLVINANQYDRGEQWLFTLFNSDGTKYVPSSGAIVGIKSDKLGIINSGSVDSQGRVVINETQQMTAAVGKAVFELLIDDQSHGTANFIVLVEPKPGDNADLSESDLSLIQRAIDGTSATAIAQGVTDWMDDNLTPTTPVVDQSLTVSGAAADSAKVGQEISDLKSQISDIEEQIEGGTGSGLTEDVKTALMNCFNYVAWKDNDPNASQYISALQTALYPPANLSSISAVYTQSGTVYNTDSLDSLKSDLVVTAHMSDGTSQTVTTYALSGTLSEGTSTITATYGGKTTTFNVTVSAAPVNYNLNYAFSDITLTDGYINDSGEIASPVASEKFYDELIPAVGFCLVTSSGSAYTTASGGPLRLAEYDSTEAFIARSYAVTANKIIGSNNPSFIKMGFSNYDLVSSADVDRFVALNQLDTTLCTIPNMNVDTDGNEVAMNDVSLSDYLPVNGDGYIVGCAINKNDGIVIAFFDSNKSIISRNVIINQNNAVVPYAIPQNAKYVRFRCVTQPQAAQYISYVR